MTLDQFMTTNNISNSQFAELIGISREAVRRYRTGERRPEWELLSKITAQTDGAVTPNDFLASPPPPIEGEAA